MFDTPIGEVLPLFIVHTITISSTFIVAVGLLYVLVQGLGESLFGRTVYTMVFRVGCLLLAFKSIYQFINCLHSVLDPVNIPPHHAPTMLYVGIAMMVVLGIREAKSALKDTKGNNNNGYIIPH